MLTLATVVGSGRRILPAHHRLGASDVATGVKRHLAKTPRVNGSSLVEKASQKQDAPIIQQKDLSAREKHDGIHDMPLCTKAASGVVKHCGLGSCRCGWSQQCYPKFALGTPRVDEGVCETAMSVLFLVSALVFASVLAAHVGLRTLLQHSAAAGTDGGPSEFADLDLRQSKASSSFAGRKKFPTTSTTSGPLSSGSSGSESDDSCDDCPPHDLKQTEYIEVPALETQAARDSTPSEGKQDAIHTVSAEVQVSVVQAATARPQASESSLEAGIEETLAQ